MWTVRENVSPDGIPIFVASSRVATGVGERYIAQDVIFVRGSGYGHLGGVCGVKWISVFMCTGGR